MIDALQSQSPSRRLSEGSLREILKAPVEIREKAAHLVLYSEGCDEPLSEDRAREEIQYKLIPEWKKEKDWAAGMEKRREQVAKELKAARKVPNPNIINVQVQPWGRGSHGILQPKPALDKVSNTLRTVDAPDGLTWFDLAVRMNAPVYVIPPHGDLMVSAKQMFDFDESLHEYAEQKPGALSDQELKPWLKSSKPVRKVKQQDAFCIDHKPAE